MAEITGETMGLTPGGGKDELARTMPPGGQGLGGLPATTGNGL